LPRAQTSPIVFCVACGAGSNVDALHRCKCLFVDKKALYGDDVANASLQFKMTRNSEEMLTLAGGSGAVGRADERAYSPPSNIGGAVVT